jgi:phosphoglucosamine mutase
MGRLFGTDGVRGVANSKLSPELAFKIGRAGAYILNENKNNGCIVIGKDTRISGDMLEAALIAGICSVGVNVVRLGVLPTPAIAYLTGKLGAVGGIVISASHNPVDDNGIKFFGANGYKLTDQVEDRIEETMKKDFSELPIPTGDAVGRVSNLDNALDQYIQYAKDSFKTSLKGLKIVVDCANGAAYQAAPRIYSEMGATVIPIYHQPDGTNINYNCGSTHPEALMETVLAVGADLGVAHDGDADRMLAVDAQGRLVDGDQIMVICASHLKNQGRLKDDTVVVTVMSNLGLCRAFENAGIKVLETGVGDRYVLEEMLRSGANYGGEQSGHVISLEHNTTGDGIFTAMQLVTVMQETGQPLAELAAQMEHYPQMLVNVQVKDKELVMNRPALAQAISELEKSIAGNGRILVRASGTEQLVRVMAEHRDLKELERVVGGLVKLINKIK